MVAPACLDSIREALKKLAADEGADHVIVCKLNHINGMSEETFKWGSSSFNVIPVYSVYERLARKFSNKYRKD